MKKVKFIRIISAILIFLIACSMCACGQAKPLSEEEIAELRQTYPICDYNPLISASDIESLDVFLDDENFAAFVTVTVTGEWESETKSIDSGMGMSDVSALYLPVHIDSVLCKSENADISPSDQIFKFTEAFTSTCKDAFQKGKQYVMLIYAPDSDSAFTLHKDAYSTDSPLCYYLTDDDVLLSVNDIFTAIDQYSGWSVGAFTSEMKKLVD